MTWRVLMLDPPFLNYNASYDVGSIVSCDKSDTRALTHTASYDVASHICQALSAGSSRAAPSSGGGAGAGAGGSTRVAAASSVSASAYHYGPELSISMDDFEDGDVDDDSEEEDDDDDDADGSVVGLQGCHFGLASWNLGSLILIGRIPYLPVS
jgi:hypothetical protein